MLLPVLGTVIATVFLGSAVRAIRLGDFTGPRKLVHGTPVGVGHIRRAERPVAFWLCVLAYLGFGMAVLAGIWLVI